jgi:hypothetical protein
MTPTHFANHARASASVIDIDAKTHFMCPKQWLTFITSGVARWMMSLPESPQPCCDLNVLGVDGTTGGIKGAVMSDIQPVWMPPEGIREPTVPWSILERCCVYNAPGSGKNITRANSLRAECRSLLKTLVSSSTEHVDFLVAAEELTGYAESDTRIPAAILNEFKRFSTLSSKDETSKLRPILVCVASDECVFQVIHPNQLDHMRLILNSLLAASPSRAHWDANSDLLRNAGMGPEFVALINFQFHHHSRPQRTTLEMFSYLSEF